MTASGGLTEALGGGWDASQLPSPVQLPLITASSVIDGPPLYGQSTNRHLDYFGTELTRRMASVTSAVTMIKPTTEQMTTVNISWRF